MLGGVKKYSFQAARINEFFSLGYKFIFFRGQDVLLKQSIMKISDTHKKLTKNGWHEKCKLGRGDSLLMSKIHKIVIKQDVYNLFFICILILDRVFWWPCGKGTNHYLSVFRRLNLSFLKLISVKNLSCFKNFKEIWINLGQVSSLTKSSQWRIKSTIFWRGEGLLGFSKIWSFFSLAHALKNCLKFTRGGIRKYFSRPFFCSQV